MRSRSAPFVRLRRSLAIIGAPAVVRAVRGRNLTYLGTAALRDLYDEVRRADRERRGGTIVEIGCALGGSAIVMAAAKAPDRAMAVYDVFGMPPGPSAGDGPDVTMRYAEIAGGRSAGIGREVYYGYRPDLLAEVRNNFETFGIDPRANAVTFVQGLVQDTLHPDQPIAVAHLDCDRYASMKVSLERIAPMLADGGVMLIDDYLSKSGCARAVDEFLSAHSGFRMVAGVRPRIVRA
jgi:asparagine synthase (glutamine-hydrolysing)